MGRRFSSRLLGWLRAIAGSDADWGSREINVVALSLTLVAAWMVMTAVYFTDGDLPMARFAAVVSVTSCLPLVLLRVAGANAAGNVMVSVVFAVLLMHGHGMGEERAALSMVTVPVGCALALGGRASLIWTFIAALGAASISWAEDLTHLVGNVLFVIGTGGVSAFVERGRERARRRAQSARAQATASTLELKGQQERFARVVDRAFDAVIEVELPSGTVLAASDGVEVLFGRSPSEFVGVDSAEFFRAVLQEEEDGGFLRMLARSRKAETIDVRCRHMAGHDVVVECAGGEFLDRSKRRAIIAVRDVTTERAATAGIEERERLETVSRLAGGVAHDFNNLLTVVLGCAEALPDSTEQQGIVRAARKAKALTTQLMAFSRRAPQRSVSIDLASTVVEAVDLIEHAMPENIVVIAELETGLTVALDPNRLHQVLLNLAFNARDAMPGGGEIRIVVRSDFEHSLPRAKVEVIDGGEGMDAATRQRAFEPFFTTKPVGKGTGLGLASVYGIVRAFDGTVDIRSEPGEGTRVCLRFPLVSGEAHRSIDDSSMGDTDQQTVLLADCRILLIEDEPGVRTLLAGALRRHGAVVEERGDGVGIVGVAESFRPDVVITDMVMPLSSGPQVLADLRARWPELPMLVVSGHEPERGEGIELDHKTRFLAKPFMGKTLVRNVAYLLQARDEAAAAQQRALA